MQNLLEELKTALQGDTRLVVDDGLVKNKIIELALAMDTDLIGLLLNTVTLKKQFFVKVGKVLVFDKVAFQRFVSNKQFLPDSYTAFKNKIGLTADNEYLTESREVVLSWPYKDCVLQGGQTKEDQKRKEIFWNETLAPDEIDRLLKPKVLTSFEKYDKSGARQVKQITLDDNLIIKGNNLLALHSLKKQYVGKVKLIYIDPPYNTGGNGDTFEYNNSFKHSTWLTFMQNRLQTARNLLTEDGVLIVAIDENEQARLGILLKEIFNNYEIHCITIVHNPRGIIGANFSYTHEYAFFVFPTGQKAIGNRKIKVENIKWRNLRDNGGESLRKDAKNCFYSFIIKDEKIIGYGDVLDSNVHPEKQSKSENNGFLVYPIDKQGVERKWRYARQSITKVQHLLRVKKSKDGDYEIEIGKDFGMYRTVWSDSRYDANEYGTKLIKSLVPNCTFTFPKSLYNVYDCIYAAVGQDKNAIVLDYHAGSGTTAHAVIQMNKEDSGNRKYILCEQMDYVQDVTVARVKAVLAKENVKDDFIYCELAQHNAKIIDKIEKANTSAKLVKIWREIENTDFISYKIEPSIVNTNITEFKKLSLNEQKQFLLDVLDKNQLYVNYADIDDKDYKISQRDKKLNQQFYGD